MSTKKSKDCNPSDSSEAAFYLGLTYKQSGNYSEAAKNLRDSIRLVPSVKDAYPELIEVLYNLNEMKEAMDWVKSAEKEGVKPAHIAFLKGLVLSKEDKNREAINAFNKAKELNPSLTQSSDFQIAMAQAKERRFAEAKEILKDLNLRFEYSYTKAHSSIDIYKYDRNVYTVGFEYTF